MRVYKNRSDTKQRVYGIQKAYVIGKQVRSSKGAMNGVLVEHASAPGQEKEER